MVASVRTAAIIGLDSHEILTEVDLHLGVPRFMVVGLPDAAVNEAKERVRSAIKNSGYQFPTKVIVVNLAPADIKKEGTRFDLPIAVSILASDGVIDNPKLNEYAFIGELSLDGSLRAVAGVLPIAAGLKDKGYLK